MALTREQTKDVQALYDRGLRPAAIAAAYGVTARRVFQIVQEEDATDDEVAEAVAAARELAAGRDTTRALLDRIYAGCEGMFDQP